MKKQAFSYLARVGVQKITGLLLYLIGAEFTLTYAGIVYFVYLFLATIVISLILFKANADTLAQRWRTLFWNLRQGFKVTETRRCAPQDHIKLCDIPHIAG